MSIDAYLTGTSPSPHFLHLAPPRRCRIAILGHRYGRHRPRAAARSRPGARPRPDAHPRPAGRRQVSHARWPDCLMDRIEDILTSDVHVIVELIGGISPPAEWIRNPRCGGASRLAAEQAGDGPRLFAADAGSAPGPPVEVRGSGRRRDADRGGPGVHRICVTRITAILNGTSNSARRTRTGCTLAAARTRAHAALPRRIRRPTSTVDAR